MLVLGIFNCFIFMVCNVLLIFSCCLYRKLRLIVYLKMRLIYEGWKNICRGALIGVNGVIYCLVIAFVAANQMFQATFMLVIAAATLKYVITLTITLPYLNYK